MKAFTLYLSFLVSFANAFVPFIDGGKTMPKLYDGWFNDRIPKQASTAVAKAMADGKVSKCGIFMLVSSSYNLYLPFYC